MLGLHCKSQMRSFTGPNGSLLHWVWLATAGTAIMLGRSGRQVRFAHASYILKRASELDQRSLKPGHDVLRQQLYCCTPSYCWAVFAAVPAYRLDTPRTVFTDHFWFHQNIHAQWSCRASRVNCYWYSGKF
jgi:hypothetical protein